MSVPNSTTAFPLSLRVKIHPVHKGGALLATASVTLAECFAIKDVKVISGKNGPFVAMPSRQVNGEYRDTCFPCTKEFKQQFDRQILEAYAKMQSNMDGQQPRGDESPLGANL